jgi:hypothetical protein
MKILIFTEGTLLMHRGAVGRPRPEIVEQVKEEEPAVKDYSSYLAIGSAPQKIAKWQKEGAKILYLTSRRTPQQIEEIRTVLRKQGFPSGELLFRYLFS